CRYRPCGRPIPAVGQMGRPVTCYLIPVTYTNMDFRTILSPQESPFQINYTDKLLALGSCFAEHIGQRLIDHKFSLQLNPFGILYNPLSILQALEFLRSATAVGEDELFLHQDLWHHFA